jgi:hypothetical protein
LRIRRANKQKLIGAAVPRIVISYRREDSKWITGRIFDRLENHFGHGNVFMDIDNVPLGKDFRDHLHDALSQCDILLAVVGPRWLEVNEDGQSRLGEEQDWVRIEIETAMAKKIPIIPLLIDQTKMPKPAELPVELRNFAFRQAAAIDTGIDFRTHMDRLVRSIERLQPAESIPMVEPLQTTLVAPTTKASPDNFIEDEREASDVEVTATRATPAIENPQNQFSSFQSRSGENSLASLIATASLIAFVAGVGLYLYFKY